MKMSYIDHMDFEDMGLDGQGEPLIQRGCRPDKLQEQERREAEIDRRRGYTWTPGGGKIPL